ncbi:hypothetical protein ACIQCG_14730 [Streptomyces noursei]|uniref:hypothetical protein n=1 Tax=Streptomyces noursei TaxID=1971 RepID=UPI0038261189
MLISFKDLVVLKISRWPFVYAGLIPTPEQTPRIRSNPYTTSQDATHRACTFTAWNRTKEISLPDRLPPCAPRVVARHWLTTGSLDHVVRNTYERARDEPQLKLGATPSGSQYSHHGTLA